MKEPVDHIERPRLPWRLPDELAITECGHDTSKVKSLTRDEFARRLKEYGTQRTALLTCMTCMDTHRRWPTWEKDPRGALSREIEWEYDSWRQRDKRERGTRLKDELMAVQQLIERYPDEFRELRDTVRERQEWLERKAAKEKPVRHKYDGI